MPKNRIKKLLPHPSKITKSGSLTVFGDVIHDPNLWHINRQSVSRAFFIGIFCAFLPFPGQTVIAVLLAMLVHANLPISVILIWVSNPITIPPMFYSTYKLGTWLLQIPETSFTIELSWQWLTNEFALIWQPLLLGSMVCGVLFGAIGYYCMLGFWRWSVIKRWEERKKQREDLNRDSQ
jgi:uncharacterized protein (DUF2062 family)